MRTPPHKHDFAALLEAHKGILAKVALAYCKTPEDRADLMQEMALQLWRSLVRFDGRIRFSTWMYRIAMNVAISFYRAERRRIRDTVPVETCGIEIVSGDAPLELASDRSRLLEQFLQQLDEIDRALLVMYLDGSPQDEIADVIGTSVGNVSTRIGRLKQRFQKQFSDQ